MPARLLDRAGNPDRDIEFRRHHLPVWPTCQSFGAYPHRPRARRTDPAPELVGERLDILAKFCGSEWRGRETMIFRECQFGTISWRFLADKLERPGSAADAGISTAALRVSVAANVESHGDDLLGVLRFTVWIRVAGIDRPLEGIGATT